MRTMTSTVATKQVIKVTRETLFKREPKPSSELSPEALHRVPAGTELEIHSYAYADGNVDFAGHVKFAIRNPQQSIRGINTWFAYSKHIEIEFNGRVVFPEEEQSAHLVLEITQDTILKRQPVDSSQLPTDQKVAIARGSSIALHSYAFADAKGSFNNHIKFAIADASDYINSFSTWYVYDQHARVELNDELVYPKASSSRPTTPPPSTRPTTPTTPGSYRGKAIVLPGGRGTVYTDQPIIAGGAFTWGEATHNGVRIPQQVAHVDNMIRLATQLEKARQQIGRPFIVTSWYRPDPWNARVGGARRSQHLTGSGVDIVVDGFLGRQLGQRLMSWWPGGLGIYPGNRQHILHLDIGPKRNWGF